MAFSPIGSGDSGAAGGPSSSAIKIPASTNAAPTSALLPSLSRSKMYEVTEANTGSSVNKIAAWLEVVYCCAQSWIEKASAVASTAQMAIPRSDSTCHPKRAGCQPDADAQTGGEPRQSGARSYLEHAERGNRVPPSVIPNQNDMHGVEPRSDECEEVAAVEVREALRRHGEKIEAENGSEHSTINPERQAASPEDPQQERNQDDAGARDKAGLGGSRILQACGLKCVTSKHEEAESGAGEKLFPFQRSKHARAECGHEERCQSESSGKKDKDRGIGERVFDDDKSRSPEQAAKGERKIGAEALAHSNEIPQWNRDAPVYGLEEKVARQRGKLGR